MALPLGDGMVLLGRDRDRLHVLNGTGRFIWEALEAGQDVPAICGDLSERFAVPLRQAETDVRAALVQWRAAGLLAQKGLVQPCEATASPVVRSFPDARRPRRWWAEHACRLFEQELCFRFGDGVLRAALLPLLAHLSCADQDGTAIVFSVDRHAGAYRLFRGDLLVGSYGDIGTLQLTLNREVTLLGCEACENLMVLHAGAVSDGDSAIVLPAPGGHGKSTLTAALAARGLRYLGDDVIPLERHTQHAVPVPTCLNLKGGSLEPLRPLYPDIDRVAAIARRNLDLYLTPPPGFRENPPTRTYSVRHIVFPNYERNARTRLQPIAPIEALQRLVASDFLMDRPLDPQKVGELVAWLDGVPAWSLGFDALDDACDRVLKLFAE